MKLTSLIYRLFLNFYHIFPFKKSLLFFAKKTQYFTRNKNYRDLKFHGVFEVRINSIKKSFKLFNWNSSIETSIFWTGLENGDWEPETIPIWVKLCKNANVVFDIGANTGIYSLIARTCNPKSTIIAFEPSDLIISKFKSNMDINNYNVSLVEKGISNLSGKKVFYDVENNHQTSASLDPEKLKNFKNFSGKIREYQIETIRLDDFIIQNNIYPDLIKIDVELHEPEVLEGMGNYLINCQSAIIIEVLTLGVAERLNQILKNSNFQFFSLEKDKIEKVYELTPKGTIYNYLLLPKGKNLNDFI